MTPVSPEYVRLTFAILATAIAELFWDKNRTKAVFFGIGAAGLWLSFILHATGVL
jgi:hypothetical protein